MTKLDSAFHAVCNHCDLKTEYKNMKKEFSFYEFVGIIVPSVTLLFFLNATYTICFQQPYIDFKNIGESLIFIIIAYGFGHILQAISNIFESIVWLIAGGMPTEWLLKKNRFGKRLLDKSTTDKIKIKLHNEYGNDNQTRYGRLVLNKIRLGQKAATAEIFNGNYSLMRGLATTFLIMAIASFILFKAWIGFSFLLLMALATFRMIRFALSFGREIFRTYLNF
jgi:hypothetical protein